MAFVSGFRALRSKLALHIIALVSLVGLTSPGSAADFTVVPLESDVTAILLVGDIEQRDATEFNAIAERYQKAVVLLESNGGSTIAAIRIGEAVRSKRFATAVVNGSACNSACALIWLAGVPRVLSKSGRVGFHATYIEERGEQRESGLGNAIVGRYLTLLDLPERAVIFATVAPPNELNWLDSQNYKLAGVELTVVDDMDLGGSSSEQDDLAGDTESWRKVGDWTIWVDDSLNRGCFAATRYMSGTIFRVGVNAKEPGSYYLLFGNRKWASLREGSKYELSFKFGLETPWTVPAKAVRLGGNVFLLASFSDNLFWGEFVNAHNLSISRARKSVANLSLSGTAAAFQELVRCQKHQNQIARR